MSADQKMIRDKRFVNLNNPHGNPNKENDMIDTDFSEYSTIFKRTYGTNY